MPFSPFSEPDTLSNSWPQTSAETDLTLQAFREYVFADDADDHARLAIQHKGMKPVIVEQLKQALDKYGLAKRFEAYKQMSEQVLKPGRVLDFGCGEGLFLHDLAELLEGRELVEVVELNGIDKNSAAIYTAEEYTHLSNPPRPYLNFYVHDGSRPLEECALLRRESSTGNPVSFDFIYATMVMEHLPQAREQVAKLYQALKPGGVIYFYGCDLEQIYNEFEHFHPTLKFFGQAVAKMIMSVNPGVNVAREQAGWLKDLGAEQIEARPVAIVVGDKTEYGRWLLKDTVMLARATGRILVERGVLTQARFEQMMADLYRDLTTERQGQGWFIHTMARKPAASSLVL